MARQARLKFPLNAGLLARGQVINQIRAYCWQADLQLEYQEHKGLLSSTYYIIIKGDEDRVRQFERDIQTWVDNQFY